MDAMPIVHGNFGSGQPEVSTPAPPREDPNTLQSKATARIVDVLGEGEIRGLVDGEKSIYLDGTPLLGEDGEYNFKGVTTTFRPGTPDQAYIPGIRDVTAPSEQFHAQVKASQPPVQKAVTTNRDVDAIVLQLDVPALYRQDDAGNLTGTSIQYRIEYRVNGGAWTPFVPQGAAADGTITLTGKCVGVYQWQYRLDLPARDRNSTDPYAVDVRVTRLTADNEGAGASTRLANDLYWDSYSEVVDQRISYADSAVVGFVADAEAFGSRIPVRGYEIFGKLIRVPTGYDPEARTYPEFWDGTFSAPVYCNNPAWVFHDLAENDRYGLAEYGELPEVNIWALYEIARFCDELVPDGKGGLEPRYQFNGVIQRREDAYKVLMALAGVFRGMLHWSGLGLTATADMPSDPVKDVNQANVLDGRFSYAGTSLKVRHTVALVTWNDPADRYRAAVEVVERPELIARYGWIPAEIVAVGCTSQGAARRYGEMALDSEEHETDTVGYRASFDHADVAPGQIVRVADPHYLGLRRGGRVKAATADVVTLDAPVTLAAGESYELVVTSPAGLPVKRTVANGPGETSGISLAEPLEADEIPLAGAVWNLLGSDAQPRLFRVISNVEDEPNIYSITGLFHDPTKWARIEQGLQLEPPSYTAIPTGPLAAPGALAHQEIRLPTGNGYVPGVVLTWGRSADPRAGWYDVQIWRPGEAKWDDLGRTSDTTWTQREGIFTAGPYHFRVRAVSGAGSLASRWSELRDVWIEGKTEAPSDVLALTVAFAAEGVRISWAAIGDADAAGYEVRVGTDWLAASTAWRGDATACVLPLFGPGSYTVQVKAFDTSGNESLAPSFAVVEVAAPAAPTVAYALVGAVVRFSVSPFPGSYPLEATTAVDGAGGVWELSGGALDVPVTWTGTRTFTFTSWDVHGNAGAERAVPVAVAALGAPTGLVATGLPYSIKLAAAYPLSPNLAAVEFWMATANDRAQAVLAAESASGTAVVSGLPLVATRYFWARCRDRYGNLSGWYPAGAVAGIQGQTSTDPSYFTALLTGALTEDLLHQSVVDILNSVENLDAAIAGLVSLEDGILEPGVVVAHAGDVRALDLRLTRATAGLASAEEVIFALSDTEAGPLAGYLLRTNVHGHVAGFGLVNDGAFAEFIVQADRFIIADPDGNPNEPPFYLGALPQGGTGLVLRGDLIAKGSVLAESLAVEQLSAITADLGSIASGAIEAGELAVREGGRIVVGDGNVIIDSADNCLYAAEDGGPVDGNDYMRLTQGELQMYRWLGGQHRLHKALNKLVTGVAQNNVEVELGWFAAEPRVMISPHNLQSFSGEHFNQSQFFHLAFELREDPAGSAFWKMKPVATLTLDPAGGAVNVGAQASNAADGSGNVITTAATNTPDNCTGMTVHAQLSSVRPTTTSNTYYYRKVYWRPVIDGAPYGNWIEQAMGATIDPVAVQTTVSGLASGVHSVAVQSYAVDAGGAFTTAPPVYDYQDFSATSGGQSVTASGSGVTSVSNAVPVSLAAPSIPAGWSVSSYARSMAFTLSGSVNTPAGANVYGSITGQTIVALFPGSGSQSVSSSPGYSDASGVTGFNLQVSASTRGVDSQGHAWPGTFNLTFTLASATITAHCYKAQGNGGAYSNVTRMESFAFVLSAATVLAAGDVNYIAIGD